jgi:hypothetical protein
MGAEAERFQIQGLQVLVRQTASRAHVHARTHTRIQGGGRYR